MNATTIFTSGYYGWGNHTPQLVEGVDAVETNRGFKPPLFVDIRIRRSVRAKGFLGSAFEKRLGPSRHRWMKYLGNKFILTRTGPNIQIADPSAADDLLHLALESATHRQRLLFFCSCQWPKFDGELACHRTTVAGLVLKAAKKRGVAVEIVEWPGGEPKQIELDVTPEVFAAVRRGRKTVPLGKQPDLAQVAGLPWCSTVTIKSNGESLHRVVGPAIRQPEQWVLPMLVEFFDDSPNLADRQKEAERLRRSFGLNAASFCPGQPSLMPDLLKGMTMESQYTPQSVYTILHSKTLENMYRDDRLGTFTENKQWVTANKLLKAARSAEQVVPVIFAFAEETSGLAYFAELGDLKMRQDAKGKWKTEVWIKQLTKIPAPHPHKTQLRLSSTGERLSASFIRPYAIVETPSSLLNQART